MSAESLVIGKLFLFRKMLALLYIHMTWLALSVYSVWVPGRQVECTPEPGARS